MNQRLVYSRVKISLEQFCPVPCVLIKFTKKLREIIIAGIVKDFQYSSLKSVIEPAMILYDPSSGYKLLVKPNANQVTQANQAIARLWKKYVPDYPLETENNRGSI